MKKRMIVAKATIDMHIMMNGTGTGTMVMSFFPCFHVLDLFHVGFYIQQVLKKENELRNDKKVEFTHFFL